MACSAAVHFTAQAWEAEYDFDHAGQVTIEDDFVRGFKDLRVIRKQVKPQPPTWPDVLDDAVFQSPAWQNVEKVVEFWKLYAQRPPAALVVGEQKRSSLEWDRSRCLPQSRDQSAQDRCASWCKKGRVRVRTRSEHG